MSRSGPLRGWWGWLGFAAIAAAAQGTVLPWLRPFDPDVTVIALGFLALEARRDVILPGAVMLGAMTALFSVESPAWRVGLHAGTALAVFGIRPWLFRDHAVTRFLVFAAMAALVRIAEAGVVLPLGRGDVLWRGGIDVLGSALATGLIAIPADPLMRRLGLCGRLAPVRES